MVWGSIALCVRRSSFGANHPDEDAKAMVASWLPAEEDDKAAPASR